MFTVFLFCVMEAYKNEFIKQSKNELKPTYSDMTLALPFVSLFRPTYIACNLVKKTILISSGLT